MSKISKHTITINFEDIGFDLVSWFQSDFAGSDFDPELLKEFFEGEIVDCINRFLTQEKYVAVGANGGASLE